MQTSALISELRRDHPDWSRMALLTLVNDIQDLIFAVPTEFMLFKDTVSGGNYPLETTTGALEYTLDAVSDPYGGGETSFARIMHIGSVSTSKTDDGVYNNASVTESPVYQIFQGSSYAGAKIVFEDDPGDGSLDQDNNDSGSVQYFLEAYKAPTELTTESVSLTLPDNYHIDLMDAVSARIYKRTHGNMQSWRDFVENVLPKIRDGLNNSTHTATYVQSRGF